MALAATSTESAEPQATIYTDLEAASSLEEQFIILATALQDAEAKFNKDSNPTPILNAIQVTPDFEDASVEVEASLRIKTESAGLALKNAVLEYIV